METITIEQTDYQKQATDFLARAGLEFRAVLIGDDCPKFCEDARAGKDMDKVNVFPRRTHIHGKHYRCTVSGQGRGHVAFEFWNSYSDEKHNATAFKGKRRPTPYDLLACITKHDPGTFENFCSDFGYDEDSRRAEGVYRDVRAEFRKVARFFTAEEMEELQEIN